MELYDQTNIDQLEWPETSEGRQAKDLFLPMVKEGVEKYIRNVKTHLCLLKIANIVIPVTINEREYSNSYLTSNYFPINYLDELTGQKYPRFAFLQKPLTWGIGLLLKGMKVNKTIIVNNWLLTSNIYPELNEEQVQRITDFMVKKFSDHMIIFRSLNARICSDLTTHLEKHRYRVMGSRFVYVYDPANKASLSSKVKYHHRRDRRLIESEGYEIVRSEGIQPDEIERLIKLYRHIYLSRHTKYSPEYTEKFLKKAIDKGFFSIIGLKKEGEIQGVMGCYERNGTLCVPFFGYDTDKGGPNHLYRMLTILAIEESEKRNLLLSDGSGGAAPKRFRGMKPFPEYVALYDRHLPFHRRFFWGLAEKVMNKIAFPLLKRNFVD